MEAIIQSGGRQYQVSKGQKILVNRLTAEKGSDVTFDVMALYGDKPQIGEPVVKGAKVVAKVLSHDRGDKIIVATYKRRKGYHKKHGHRQELTQLEIKEINAQ